MEEEKSSYIRLLFDEKIVFFFLIINLDTYILCCVPGKTIPTIRLYRLVTP